MKLSSYDPNKADEIEQLFTKTFSDSEGQSEGDLIGRLVVEMMGSSWRLRMAILNFTPKSDLV